MSTSVMSPMPIASAVTCEPSGIAKSAGWPDTADVDASGVPCTASGSTSSSSTLAGVTSSPMSMSSVATRTVWRTSSAGTSAVALVEQDDDGDEGKDGKQYADEDDEAIRSLHERSPLSSG